MIGAHSKPSRSPSGPRRRPQAIMVLAAAFSRRPIRLRARTVRRCRLPTTTDPSADNGRDSPPRHRLSADIELLDRTGGKVGQLRAVVRTVHADAFLVVLAGLLDVRDIPVWKRGPSPPEQKAGKAAAAAGITLSRIAPAVRSSDDGRMSREDAIAAFGFDPADGADGALSGGKPVGRKQRKPFAPRVDHGLPAPWSELLRPVGLPSMEP